MKFYFISIIALCNLNLAIAQNDFVVTNKGDTIYGTAITKSWRGIISGNVKMRFKDANGKGKDTFTPDDLKCTYHDNTLYETQMIKGVFDETYREKIVKVFMKKIISGKLSLYEYVYTGPKGTAFGDVTDYYFKKDKDVTVTIAPSNKSGLIDYFKDCEAVQGALKNKDIKKKDFEKMVGLYNSTCGG